MRAISFALCIGWNAVHDNPLVKRLVRVLDGVHSYIWARRGKIEAAPQQLVVQQALDLRILKVWGEVGNGLVWPGVG